MSDENNVVEGAPVEEATPVVEENKPVEEEKKEEGLENATSAADEALEEGEVA